MLSQLTIPGLYKVVYNRFYKGEVPVTFVYDLGPKPIATRVPP